MTSSGRWILALAGFFWLQVVSQSQTSGGELDLGVDAYKQSRYEEAIEHFRRATELDPTNIHARMYLAAAYGGQFIPGVDSPDNVGIAEKAQEQYHYVLDSDAPTESKVNSAKGIAYLYLNMKKFDLAKRYYEIASGLDSKDPEPYYSIAVIDWSLCYQPRMQASAHLDLKPEDQLDGKIPAQKRMCDRLGLKNRSMIAEGMDNLRKALELRPDYDDAMAYLNLMYRERAALECDDPAARKRDLQAADHWVDRTLITKKVKAEKANPPAASTEPNPQ